MAGDPIISEFLASNDGGLRDGYGVTPDWIGVFNPSEKAIDLQGYRLTDDPDQLTKWRFPRVIIEPYGTLVVFASGQDHVDPAGNFHTNFPLDVQGDYLALVRPNVLQD